MLGVWVQDNNSQNWALELKFVQMQKIIHIIQPLNALHTFGKKMNCGLNSTLVPKID